MFRRDLNERYKKGSENCSRTLKTYVDSALTPDVWWEPSEVSVLCFRLPYPDSFSYFRFGKYAEQILHFHLKEVSACVSPDSLSKRFLPARAMLYKEVDCLSNRLRPDKSIEQASKSIR